MDRLTIDGHQVIGVDNFDPFYDRALKTTNIQAHADHPDFELLEADLADEDTYQKLNFLVGNEPVDAIIHLAAKAGVRPSIEDPFGYQRANVIATQNLLEFAKDNKIKQFVFASSSSVSLCSRSPPFFGVPSLPSAFASQLCFSALLIGPACMFLK